MKKSALFLPLGPALAVLGGVSLLSAAPLAAQEQPVARTTTISPGPVGATQEDLPPAPTSPEQVQPGDPSARTPGNDIVPAGATGEQGPTAPGADAYRPLGPEWIKGQPTAPEDDFARGMTFQEQYSEDGEYALWMHDAVLLPIIVAITLFVLALLLWVVARYNRARNPVPSKTTHNTLVEVIWTVVPALVLLAIAVPSIRLLARQYETPPEDAVTIKATGFQWYWSYSYPDNGEFEVVSNMMPEAEARAKGFPAQLEVDNRMVVPVNTPLRIQTTAADVIHSFAVPSLWFKIDAVPGRLNERLLVIKEPGIYYGQCSELCGIRHAYMPIAIEALPRPQWEAWVRAQGGTVGDEAAAPAAGAAPAAAAGAPAAGASPAAAAPAGNGAQVPPPAPAPAAATATPPAA